MTSTTASNATTETNTPADATVEALARQGRTAAEAGDFAAAAAVWRRLVRFEPANGAWRLRCAAASLRAAEPGSEAAEGAELIALQLLDASLSSGRPLLGLLAALEVEGAEPSALLSDYLAGSARLGKALRIAPPLGRAPETLVAAETPDAADAPLPDAPDAPVAGPLPPMPLLSSLDAAALTALRPHLSRRSLDATEVLMAEGEPADALYLVAHGLLEVTKEDPDRPTVRLGRVAEGAVLGEMALVLSRPRQATVTAVTEAEVLRVDVAGLRAVAAAVPAVEAALGEFTRQRVAAMLLATSPLFRDLEPPARAALLRAFQTRDLPDAVTVTRQGAEGKALRVVVSGAVDIWRSEADEPAARVAHLGPGQVFGEIALLTGQPATATVITSGPTQVLELLRPALEEVCQAFPSVTERLARIGEDRMAENRFIFQDDDFFEEAD